MLNLFFYSNNQSLSKQTLGLSEQVLSLEQEIKVLKSANLTTALGIIDIPPHAETIWGMNNYSYVWITGWVYNSGASAAKNAGLEVLAFDKTNSMLMNYTVPIVGYGVFSINDNKTLLPNYLQLTPISSGMVLSQQNVTVRVSIFHEDIFPNNTRLEINPIWQNPE